MKFDYIVGNPPYQDEKEDNGRKPPVYHLFIDECYKLSDVTELITPARFLFDAGQTPKSWNKKMLNDEHLIVKYYEPKSDKVFLNTDIKGGVTITYRNRNVCYGAILSFTAYPELNGILKKVRSYNENSFSELISSQGIYRFSKLAFENHPEISKLSGKGTGNKIVSSIVEKLPQVFLTDDGNNDCVKMLCRNTQGRFYKYIRRDYLEYNDYINTYNVLVPESNGSGALGEVLSTPLIGQPLIGHTDTFLSIGKFNSQTEAEVILKYIKTKFARALLGIKKVTQHNPRNTWEFVPMQDFTETSDIDWTQSISDVDKQLYNKYGLSKEEINFIETHVKEME